MEKLGDLCDIVIGRTPARKTAKYWGKGHPWVSISDLKEKFISNTKEEITQEAIDEVRCRLIPKGTLLFSFKLTIGKMAFSSRNLYTNEAIAGLIVKDSKKLSSEYLFYALRSARLLGSNQAAMGKTLNSKSLAAIKVSVPESINDQIRIATLLSRVESLIATRKESLRLLNEFLKSTFLEMFGDPVGNAGGWETMPFPKVGKFVSGGTPSKKRDDYWLGGFPWISPKDMKVNYIHDSQDHISELVFSETPLKKIPIDSILIVVRGMILAHSFPVAINKVEVAINQDMKAIKVSPEYNSLYLMECLHAMTRQILVLISSAGHGTKKFDSDSMGKLLIPKPSLELQNSFASIVEKVESIKSNYLSSLSELQNLYGALSQKAFKGELDLSHINLPTVDDVVTEESHQWNAEDAQPQITLATEYLMSDSKAREGLLHQLFKLFVSESKGNSFTAEAFLQQAHRKTLDYTDENSPPIGLDDYEKIKQWLFDLIDNQTVEQTFNAETNQVELKVKG
ncbi:MAG: restriction endonuclease subunit S [Candidatus Sedimenticola sp. (ex Thyasira tokunagai)]